MKIRCKHRQSRQSLVARNSLETVLKREKQTVTRSRDPKTADDVTFNPKERSSIGCMNRDLAHVDSNIKYQLLIFRSLSRSIKFLNFVTDSLKQILCLNSSTCEAINPRGNRRSFFACFSIPLFSTKPASHSTFLIRC